MRSVSTKEFTQLVVMATLAISTFGTCISLGQYTVFILAAVVAAWALDNHAQRRKSESPAASWAAIALAGIMLGAAASKPQVGLPFFLVFLIRRRFATLIASAIYLVLATGVIWLVTQTDPIEMLHQMTFSASQYATSSTTYGPAQVLSRHGVPYHAAFLVLGLGVPTVAAIAMFVWRSSPTVFLFAIAGAAGRLWTYHPLYDNGMLMFLLIGAAVAATSNRSVPARQILWAVFIVVGLTLWPRPKMCDIASYQNFQLLVWAVAPIILLVLAGVRPKSNLPAEMR
jgi:hypothetical protein